MKKMVIILLCFCLFSSSYALGAVSVRLAWDASTSSEVIGYRVYYGTASRVYHKVGETSGTTFLVEGVDDTKDIFFAVTAFSSTEESAFSTELKCAVISQAIQGPGTIEAKQEDWSRTTKESKFVVESGTNKDVIVMLIPTTIDCILSVLLMDRVPIEPVVSSLVIPNVTGNHTVFGLFMQSLQNIKISGG